MTRLHSLIIHVHSWVARHSAALITGLLMIWMAGVPHPACAQNGWFGYPGSTTISVTIDKVGIGVYPTAATLEVLGPLSQSTPLVPLNVLGNNGPVFTRDIGTGSGFGQNSAVQIGLKNTASSGIGAGPSFLFFNDNSNGAKSFLGRLSAVWENSTAGSEAGAILFSTRANSVDTNATTERLRITAGGNVGIGTSNPVHLLHVAGAIGAQEVIVSSTGADYVFQPNYPLRPLKDVAAFIEKNHHLPDIPSATEVQDKGMGLGEMQTKLLAKVEELTLHLIEANERIARLEARAATQSGK